MSRRVKCPTPDHKHNIKRRFGLTVEQWEAFVVLNPFCAVCGTVDDLVIDHDHTTGALRGRLCRKHNAAIGMLGDDPALLDAARTYLLTHVNKVC